jgi:hypothetical protein
MSNTTPDSFDDFMSQISASLQSPSGEAALRRINAERILRLMLDEIVQQRHDLQIRVLADSRISGYEGADILMQIDDYEIRIELIDIADRALSLSVDHLNIYRKIFEENPSTEALIIAWAADDLPSQKLSLLTIDYLLENNNLIQDFIDKVKPLPDVVQDILANQMKVWEDIPSLPKNEDDTTTNISTVFAKYFELAIMEERERSFKLEEKKLAVKNFPEKREADLVKNILQDALKESSIDELSNRLAQFPRRGAK